MNYSITPKIKLEAWVQSDILSLSELILKMEELGNKVIEIDYENNRIKVLQETV